MASIVEINNKRYLQLGAEEVIRKMNWGGKWTYLAICMRYSFGGFQNSFRASDAYGGLSSGFHTGVCRGPEGYMSDTCLGWYGLKQNNFNLSTFYSPTPASGYPWWFQGYDGNVESVSKVGMTRTSGGNSSANTQYYYGATAGGTIGGTIWYVTNYNNTPSTASTLQWYQASSTSGAYMQYPNIPDNGWWYGACDQSGYGYFDQRTLAAQTIPSPTWYNLDSFSVVWHTNVNPLHIYDLIVVRHFA